MAKNKKPKQEDNTSVYEVYTGGIYYVTEMKLSEARNAAQESRSISGKQSVVMEHGEVIITLEPIVRQEEVSFDSWNN